MVLKYVHFWAEIRNRQLCSGIKFLYPLTDMEFFIYRFHRQETS